MAALEQHPWQGNVRELRNVVCRALLMRKGAKIDAGDLIFEPRMSRGAAVQEEHELELPEGVMLEQMVQRLERRLIENTLRRCNYHKDKAAKRLGLARSSLFKRLKEWELGDAEAT